MAQNRQKEVDDKVFRGAQRRFLYAVMVLGGKVREMHGDLQVQAANENAQKWCGMQFALESVS